MTTLTTAVDTALRAPAVTIFGAMTIELPHRTVRLLDGSAELMIGDFEYTGIDPVFGTIGAVDDLTDGIGSEAPRLSITLLPPEDADADDLAGPELQGTFVRIEIGAMDPATGLVIPDPFLVMLGEMDVPQLKMEGGKRTLDIEIASIFERFFSDDEGIRLSSAWHETIWPGEYGFRFVTGVQERVYWGVKAPNRSLTYPVSGFFGGLGRALAQGFLQ